MVPANSLGTRMAFVVVPAPSPGLCTCLFSISSALTVVVALKLFFGSVAAQVGSVRRPDFATAFGLFDRHCLTALITTGLDYSSFLWTDSAVTAYKRLLPRQKLSPRRTIYLTGTIRLTHFPKPLLA